MVMELIVDHLRYSCGNLTVNTTKYICMHFSCCFYHIGFVFSFKYNFQKKKNNKIIIITPRNAIKTIVLFGFGFVFICQLVLGFHCFVIRAGVFFWIYLFMLLKIWPHLAMLRPLVVFCIAPSRNGIGQCLIGAWKRVNGPGCSASIFPFFPPTIDFRWKWIGCTCWRDANVAAHFWINRQHILTIYIYIFFCFN